MADSVAGVVLAAGAGTRLAPLTRERPKALCPVATVPLVDHALARLAPVVDVGAVAVNLHHGRLLLDAHLPARVHRSVEDPVALGTAGALGQMRPWLDGRDAIVTNADAWLGAGLDLGGLLQSWDRERVRLVCVHEPGLGDFGSLRYCGVALHPWSTIAGLDAEPSGLYEVSWRAEHEAGRLDLVTVDAPFIDCGTPAQYLRANLVASGGESVIDPDASVADGAEVIRSVVWDGAHVGPHDVLVDAIRTPSATVLVR